MKRSNNILERIKKERGYLHPSREILYKEDPLYLEIYHNLYNHIMKRNRSLPLKIKEMIIAAINATINYEEGLRVHLKGALKAGAKKGEIFEALEVASLPGGIHTITFSMPIYKEVCEEFKKEKRKNENNKRTRRICSRN